MEAKNYLLDHWIKKKIWTHLDWPKHQERFRRCASFLEGKSFIDVGCGLGHSTMHLHKFRYGIWSGMEFYRPIVKKAREMFPMYPFYYARSFDLIASTKGKKFDSVVCSEVIEHIEDDQALFNGLLSITEKVLIITTPNQRVSDPGHLRIYTKEMLLDLWKKFYRTLPDHKKVTPTVAVYSEATFFYFVVKI